MKDIFQVIKRPLLTEKSTRKKEEFNEVAFEVVNREGLVLDINGEVAQPVTPDGNITLPEPWETGVKDTVISYPGQVTRLRVQFLNPGQFDFYSKFVYFLHYIYGR